MRFYVTAQLSENISETPEGYLLCENVPITRTGEFLYKGNELLGDDNKPLVEPTSDGIVRIQRDEESVFDEITIRSFEGKPFTLNHPDGFVDPENWQDLTHGIIQNVRRGINEQSDLMLADILVTTKEAIDLIKSGERELSCGYDAEYEDLGSGVGRQRNIIGNHVALVSKGRAGGRCAIQDKACDHCGTCQCQKDDKQEEENVAKTKDRIAEFKDKLQKLLKWFDEDSDLPVKIKDEDKDEDEKDKKDEDQTKDKKMKDDDEPDKDKDDEKEKDTKDDDGLAAISARIDALESRVNEVLSLIQELAEEESAETGDEDPDKDDDKKDQDDDKKETGDEDDKDDDKDKDKKETGDEDDDEKKEEEEKKEVNDSWPEFLSYADILVPGKKLVKPTKDHRKTFDNMRIDILETAMEDDLFGAEIEKLAGKRGFHKLTGDALDVAFIAASNIAAGKRNSTVQKKTIDNKMNGAAQTVADINKKNKEFWNK